MAMDTAYLCMGCMENKGEAEVCPFCSWVEGTSPQSHLHILPRVVLNDKYLVGRVLGQGGFGITYLAWDIYLDRKLAIKEYFPRELVYRDGGALNVSIYTGTQSEQYTYGLSKFMAEAKNLARFEGHPNIVSVRDYFEANATAYMVMNFLDGMTMGDYLEYRGEPLLPSEALSIIYPVLDALKTIHEIGLLHRDISPDNIMITSKKRVMLLDFGAARHAIGEKGRKFSVIVKPGYAPEEQYRSNGIQGPWTDIYAVAATLYRAITGIMPPESLDRLSDDTIRTPSDLGISLDSGFEKALLKALSVDAQNRFQNINQFQKAITFQPDQVLTETIEDSTSVKLEETIGEETGQLPEVVKPEPQGKEEQNIQIPADLIPEEKREYEVKIGRSLDNDLIFDDQMVSRHHAKIIRRAAKYYIADLKSTHGTFVNGEKIDRETYLPDDSTIEISRVRLYLKRDLILSEQGQVLLNFEQLFNNVKVDSTVSANNSAIVNRLFTLLKRK